MAKKPAKRVVFAVIASLVFAPIAMIAPASATALGTITASQGGDVIVRASANATATLKVALTGYEEEEDIAARIDSRPAAAGANDVEVGDVFSMDDEEDNASFINIVIGTSNVPGTLVAPSCTTSTLPLTHVISSGGTTVLYVASGANDYFIGDPVTLSNVFGQDAANDADEDTPWSIPDGDYTITGKGSNYVVIDYAHPYSIADYDFVGDGDTISAPTAFVPASFDFDEGGWNGNAYQEQNAGETTPTVTGGVTKRCAGAERSNVGGNASISRDNITTPGDYGITVWFDADGDGIKDADEGVVKTFTLTAAGAPAKVTVTPVATSVMDDQDLEFWTYLTDSADRPTKLLYNEDEDLRENLKLTLTENTSAGVSYDFENEWYDYTWAGEDDGLASGKTYYRNSVEMDLDDDRNASVTIKVEGMVGTTAWGSASFTATVLVSSGVYKVEVKAGTKGVSDEDTYFKFPQPVCNYNLPDGLNQEGVPAWIKCVGFEDRYYYADPLTAKSITFVITGAPNTYVPFTTDDDGTGLVNPAGVVAGVTKNVLLDANGKGEVTVTAVAPTTNSYYEIEVGSWEDGNEDLNISVDYEAPNVSEDSITIDEVPADVSKIWTSVGGTTTFTVTVADQYDYRYAGYMVELKTTATSRNASKTVSVRTGLDGKAVAALKDAGTAASTDVATTKDSMNVAVYAPNQQAGDFLGGDNTYTVSYGDKIAGSLVIQGGSTGTTTCTTYVAADYFGGWVSNFAGALYPNYNCSVANELEWFSKAEALVGFRGMLLDANQAVISGYAIKVTPVTPGVKLFGAYAGEYFGPEDHLIVDSDLPAFYDFGHTDAQYITSDQLDTIYAAASKAGVNELKFEVAGHSFIGKFTAVTDKTFARNVTVTAKTPSAEIGKAITFEAKVTDGFGNGVTAAPVAFTITGGRTMGGQSSIVVPADANGVASIAVTGDVAGNVSVLASIVPTDRTWWPLGFFEMLPIAVPTINAGNQTFLPNDVPVTGFKTAATATATGTIETQAPVYSAPTLSIKKSAGRVILSGTAELGEGDIIIYVKKVGTTTWKERAKTLEVAAPGDFNGSIKALKNDVVIRVKQEGTGLFSNQVVVLGSK